MEEKSSRTNLSWTASDKLKVALLGICFVLFSIHFYPGDLGRSIRETTGNIFWFTGFSGIVTWSIVKVITRLEKAKPSWPRIARLFLVFAVLFGTMHQIEGCFKHPTGNIKGSVQNPSGPPATAGQ